jgi:hypothetical protein
MVATTELTSAVEYKNSMEEKWLWYISGAFDTNGSIGVSVKKSKNCAVNYQIKCRLVFSRPKKLPGVFDLLFEYANEVGAKYRIEDANTSERFVINKPDSVQLFLEPIMGGFIQQSERAEIMVDEIVPVLESGTPTTQQEFIELMDVVDKLNEKPIIGRRSSKYDADYFREEWDLE